MIDVGEHIDHITSRLPVHDLATLQTLDQREIDEGYRDGREGFPCGENRGQAYWHGWRNGMMDSGRMQPDWASRALVAAYVARGRLG